MKYRIVLVLLEGPHDTAFIYRILKANGYSTSRKTIKEMPSPLNLYLSNPNSFKTSSIEDMKLGTVQQSFFPKEILEIDNNTVVLFSTGGVSKSEVRQKIITQFNAVKTTNDFHAADIEKDLSLSILYFLDAEDEGLNTRLQKISKEISTAMQCSESDVCFSNGSFVKIDDINFGAFVFVNPETDKGRLEDILLPILTEFNDQIFSDAENYLSKINEYDLFKGKTNNVEARLITKVDRQDFNFEKSLISTVGQLQTSGKSNVQVIRESSYLNNEKILKNEQCKRIVEFFDKSILK